MTVENMPTNQVELLRFSTAGSVDDGKSTLIGRLLFDSKQVFEDQLEALQRSSDLTGGGTINLANLTDGLRAEREQGITIDVAYRYFATPNRNFIVADTPGHIQYTRNMVTGASTAHATIVLIDARQGVIEQTRRHAYLSSLLRVPHLIVCINKMDLVDYSQAIFEKNHHDFLQFASKLSFQEITFIPISALLGDNVVEPSTQMSWYKGPSLIKHLETLAITDHGTQDPRFSVQYIIRPSSSNAPAYHDFRGVAGNIAAGVFKVNDHVTVLPSMKSSKITQIHSYDGNLAEAFAPMAISLLLEDNLDVGRGDLVVHTDKLPRLAQEFEAMVCWMSEQTLQKGQKFVLKHLSKNTRCVVSELLHIVDLTTLEPNTEAKSLALNDIGRVKFKTMTPIAFDPYAQNRSTGGFIVIDEASNATVGAGMIAG